MNKKEEDYIRRFLNGNFSETDAEKVIDDIGKGENIDIYDKHLENKWHISSEFENTQGEEKEYLEESTRLLKKLTRKRTVLQGIKPIITVAASVILLLGVVYGSFKYMSLTKIQETIYTEVLTGVGETRSVTLSDGTRVTLNSCSKLVYPEHFLSDKRTVDLTGQAFFNVARNEEQPFVVHTGNFDVKVLGTQFDVKAYSEDEILSVNVESGKVQVDMPEAMTRLAANEKLIINTRNNNYYKETENNKVAVWRTGNLMFNKTPIREVANELERVYDCIIEFKEGQPFDNLISGEHSNKSLESVLQSLEHTSGIHYKLNLINNRVLLYKQ